MTSICRPTMAIFAETQTSEKSRVRNEPKVSLARPPSRVLETDLAT